MFKALRKKIGIIGYGNMGSAIAERIGQRHNVYAFDKDESKTHGSKGITAADSIEDLVKRVDVVILAVKPQDFDGVLNEVKDYIDDKLIISIAAGITTKDIENILGKVRVVRVMPNIGAIVGKSVSYLCKGQFLKENDLELSTRLFDLIGRSFVLPEELMNAATAVGGSGPGFWGYLFNGIPPENWKKYAENNFIPELTSAAMSFGFDKQIAKLTASLITHASTVTVSTLHITPIQLTEKVTSKGGTTEAGLEILHKGGTLEDAVKAAVKRAEELSRGRACPSRYEKF